MLIEVVAYSSATRFSFMGEGSVLRDREEAKLRLEHAIPS
jgi:hypothetical protein